MKVRLHHNGDDVFVAWKADGFISGCRGFALWRRRNGVEEVVSTWVGFVGQDHTDGERRGSNNWPIQKYQWTDYMANPGDRLQYRVIPMVGASKDSLAALTDGASDWTPEIVLDHRIDDGLSVFFNRGIVAAQWVSRRLGITDTNLQTKKLSQVIQAPGDAFREYLFGPLGHKLLELLAGASSQQQQVYAALYELDDDQLVDALVKLGQNAHVVLANGSVKKKGEDQNADGRQLLKEQVDLYDRMLSPRALGHNKFLVICEPDGSPRWVWTGSQNWTKTGLCTQANNSILIDNQDVARRYFAQWELLRDAGNETPQTLKDSNSQAMDFSTSASSARLWFTPTVGEVDLNEARGVVENAQQAILFLMFNPGPRDTVLNAIIEKARQPGDEGRLYIRGAVNQDPSTSTTAVELFEQSNREKADFEVVLPAAIDEATDWFRRELKKLPKAFAMVHSKVVLVDPFGPEPILLTGSHNLGPKASGTNDENLLIIKSSASLASAYASNIMAIYNQYRWRFRRQLQTGPRRWKGLEDGDTWQTGYLREGGSALREIDFWVGEPS